MTVITIEKSICLESKFLDKNFKHHLLTKLQQLLFSNCSKDYGHIIKVLNITEIVNHEIDRANCSNIFTVKFEVEILKPDVGTIMSGNVCMVYKDGIFIEVLKGRQKMLIPKLYLKDYIFDENILCYTKGEKSIKEEDFISAKVTACQYNNNTFSCFGYIMSFDDV